LVQLDIDPKKEQWSVNCASDLRFFSFWMMMIGRKILHRERSDISPLDEMLPLLSRAESLPTE
jgi:hypothetical protein